VNRNTFAYPTTMTDAAGFSSTVQYNFDFGATTRTQSPAPAGQSQGAIQTMSYNNLGQLERITTTNNGAFKRFWYGADFTGSYATVNNVDDEAYSIAVVDGLGRVIAAAGNHPGSAGGYSLVNTIYDQMGRAWKVSNPTEVNSSWTPSGDDKDGFYYTTQTYDWKGRPLVTTNPDNTTREASYAGCGCAGGEVVTLLDEGTIDTGVAKRRKQKVYSDVLGRMVKTEIYNWQSSNDVYSATVNTYNARDQITQVRQYAGPEASATYQDTTMSYDGYGRLNRKHVPEQNANVDTVWDYNADSAVQKITDGRGAATNYAYNNRHLLTDITYTVPQNSPIPVPGAISYQYDAAANRTLMSDATGTTTYSYDSLSRMSSESRTFTGLSGSYSLSYSYNLADALAVLSIPFRSQQIGYSHDTVNRLSGVSASGFSATFNQSTQSLSSFASNIAYRAWGGRKSMTYGNTTSEQLAYNSRLQPTTYTLNNMNYQNTNVCCTYPTYSTMTWSYGYYNDGTLEHAWDSTNEWFDRAYKYDHMGRPKEASTYRRARGLSPYPAVSNPDPYFQSITYDVWNHSSRTGKLYTGEPSDIATYANNRRADHSYDADGNTTNNGSYNQTIDAAGVLNHSVSLATVGDGLQHPFEPRLDITQTYDGTGTPAKRNQITRYPGILDEFGNQSEPVEDTKTTYSLTSSVLGGAIVVELASGWTDTVYIYAAGQRIAREEWGSVSFEHHNPVTGSWVTSIGHSSYRTTTREERDPVGAEVPLANPYPAAQSYVDWKSTQPLFIEGGDPFDYTSGRTIDGLPVSEAEFQRRIGNGSVGAGVFAGGKFAGFFDLTERSSIGYITIIIDVFNPPLELKDYPDEFPRYFYRSFEEYVELNGSRTLGNHTSTKPQNRIDEPAIEKTVLAALATKSCQDFANTVLGAQKRIGLGTLTDVAKSFFALSGSRFTRIRPPGSTLGVANPIGRISIGTAQIYSLGNDPTLTANQQILDDADNAIAELFHLAAQGSYYSDEELANAVHNSAYAADAYALMSNGKPLIDPRSNIFDPSYLPDKKDKHDRAHSFSRYFHAIQQKYCTSKPGFERGVGFQP
jgi:YD repeat-containing protein